MTDLSVPQFPLRPLLLIWKMVFDSCCDGQWGLHLHLSQAPLLWALRQQDSSPVEQLHWLFWVTNVCVDLLNYRLSAACDAFLKPHGKAGCWAQKGVCHYVHTSFSDRKSFAISLYFLSFSFSWLQFDQFNLSGRWSIFKKEKSLEKCNIF